MNTLRCSITRFVVLWAFGFGLIVAANGTARADSIAYNVLGTFSNGQKLSGQITWNSTSNSVTSSALSLSSSTFSTACSSPAGGCGAVFAGFWGAGTLSNSYEILLGAFLPNSSLFTLTVTGSGGIRIMATNASWSRVAVPEEPIIAELLIVLMGFGWLVKSGALNQFRKPVV
jgi:hypothetical protein